MTLDELVAVKVMGWTRCSDDCSATDTCFFVDTDGSVWLHGGIVPFHPSTRIVDTWEVVEKMNTNPRNISISHSPCSDRWCVQFLSYRNPDGTFNVKEGGQAEHKDACVAITLAALRACGVTEGEIDAAQDPRP